MEAITQATKVVDSTKTRTNDGLEHALRKVKGHLDLTLCLPTTNTNLNDYKKGEACGFAGSQRRAA